MKRLRKIARADKSCKLQYNDSSATVKQKQKRDGIEMGGHKSVEAIRGYSNSEI